LLRDELNNLTRSGAKGASDAELPFASRYLEREQAIQTHSSEDEPDESER
jgi:hypothetical protein